MPQASIESLLSPTAAGRQQGAVKLGERSAGPRASLRSQPARYCARTRVPFAAMFFTLSMRSIARARSFKAASTHGSPRPANCWNPTVWYLPSHASQRGRSCGRADRTTTSLRSKTASRGICTVMPHTYAISAKNVSAPPNLTCEKFHLNKKISRVALRRPRRLHWRTILLNAQCCMTDDRWAENAGVRPLLSAEFTRLPSGPEVCHRPNPRVERKARQVGG